MRAPCFCLLAAVLALANVLPSAAQAERRLAFVLGNDTYQRVEPLQKAANDARSVGARLESFGYEVTLLTDADRAETEIAFEAFLSRLAPEDTAVFFYAGHGVEIDGRNYLLPTDVGDPGSEAEAGLARQSLALSDLLGRLSERADTAIAIIDACRDNPLPGGVGTERGLAATAAPLGSFLLFSASPGEAALDRVSEDDAHPNSLFTRTLLPLMGERGLDVRALALSLRRRVSRLATEVDHRQVPAYSDGLLGDFAFLEGRAPARIGARNGARIGMREDGMRRNGRFLSDGRFVDGFPLDRRFSERDPFSDGLRFERRLANDFAHARRLDSVSGWQHFLAEHARQNPGDPRIATARARLDARLSETTAALTRRERERVQSVLAWLGFYAGPLDGIFGAQTRSAIRTWQRSERLEVTGRLTFAEARRLLSYDGLSPGFRADSTLDNSMAPRGPSRNAKPSRGRYVDASGCAREFDGTLIFCPSYQGFGALTREGF
ncbi:MAG: caspase family protein [Pseudomonadota bacterium]